MLKKRSLIILGTALMLTVPTMAFAAEDQPDSTPKSKLHDRVEKWKEHKGERHQNWMEHRQEHQQKLLDLVKEYSPDTLSKWTAAVNERNDLIDQLKDPATREKLKEYHKNQKDGLKDKGKNLTKEERKKLFQQKKTEWKAKREAHKQFRDQLKAAVDAKDKAKVAALLSKKYDQFVQTNKMIADKLEKAKSSTLNVQ
ncbi:hypothetical protein [Falsibacillus albus]|uniref:Uncharacterized protein n=1 Tax=Falsibacillus albus TaxID=2478915 RepID=A0A3L7K2W7_9BACI|nr:hypothetical protein [Falsibacillus albus]RLQ97338.1 hypothetical protein D9X91_04095 [Falsibacillus albus]